MDEVNWLLVSQVAVLLQFRRLTAEEKAHRRKEEAQSRAAQLQAQQVCHSIIPGAHF